MTPSREEAYTRWGLLVANRGVLTRDTLKVAGELLEMLHPYVNMEGAPDAAKKALDAKLREYRKMIDDLEANLEKSNELEASLGEEAAQ